MSCKNCKSTRIMNVNACCSDLCSIQYRDIERHDYVPRNIGIGGGDYVSFDFCLDCGTIQGDFPIEDIEDASDL